MALKEKIIHTEKGLKNIKNDCPRCGSTDIKFNETLGRLFCNHCKELFIPKQLDEVETNLDNLDKNIIGSGIKDIDKNYDNIITLKCSCCGAEVTIDTSEKTYGKCHWCRNTLSINERIPNGTIPDAILPFSVTKEEAKKEIEKYLLTKSKYMSEDFLKSINLENVTGVYLPYILVDAKVHCIFEGINHTDRAVKVKNEFDATVDDLSIESIINDDKNIRTNNIINSIMPFDTENCVKFESNYLIGYTCENRNLNIRDLEDTIKIQIKDIMRDYAEDRQQNGENISWKREDCYYKGTQIISVYLPVWLYSYHEKRESKDIIHYIAVNGRTKEILGSIPINKKKIIPIFCIIECISTFIGLYICYKYNASLVSIILIIIFSMVPGFSYYYTTEEKYRKEFVRHTYEKETKISITNSVTNDTIIEEDYFRNKYNGSQEVEMINLKYILKIIISAIVILIKALLAIFIYVIIFILLAYGIGYIIQFFY